jgi:hypothetical protein
MPIGQADIAVPVPGYDAQNLVEALYTPDESPLSRGYLTPLIQLVTQTAADAYSGLLPVGGGPIQLNPQAYILPAPLAAVLAPPPAATAPPVVSTPAAELVSLLNPLEFETMIDTWWQIWTAVGGVGNPSDIALLNVLRDYIGDPQDVVATGGVPVPLSMWVPQFVYDGSIGDQIRLFLTGYNQVILYAGGAWQQAGVLQFLQYLAFGAHFVAISAPRALPGLAPVVQPFMTVFEAALRGQSRKAKAHSHYTESKGFGNLGAAYTYPALVNTENAPAGCPYVIAFLVGRTAWGFTAEWNTFFQLEGWPTTGVTGIGGRHGKDFKAHDSTKWNISTYGASVFSEKRGTTIFLAPPTWRGGNPQPQVPSIMAPYVGAETAQSWLDKNLVRF